MQLLIKRLAVLCSAFFAVGILVSTVGCSGSNGVLQLGQSRHFVQDYNPAYLDVLWVLNDQTPMGRSSEAVASIGSQAGALFTQLDGATETDYRMAITTADSLYNRGQLLPQGNPVTFSKGDGSLSTRESYFQSVFASVVNLHTSAVDQGLEAARLAMTSSLIPRAKIPYVLIFVSDEDDHSDQIAATNNVQFYHDQYLQLVNNDPTLLRVYSVNYVPLPAGTSQTDQNYRCADEFNADIDKTDGSFSAPGKYFSLANLFNTGSTKVTANLCGGTFGTDINIDGVKLKTLPSSFLLNSPVNASTIQVELLDANGNALSISWTYDAATNSIDFASVPPEGSTIDVTFNTP